MTKPKGVQMDKNGIQEEVLRVVKDKLLAQEVKGAMDNMAPLVRKMLGEVVASEKVQKMIREAIENELIHSVLENDELLRDVLSDRELDRLRRKMVLSVLQPKALKD